MKLIKSTILLLVCVFTVLNTIGQANASLNILTLNSGQVIQGQTVDIQVTIGATAGTGGQQGPIGVNKVRAQISTPVSLVSLLPIVQQTGLPPGWTITVLNTVTGSITICNGTDIIPVNQQRVILIKVQGNNVGGPSTINGNLLFSNGIACGSTGTLAGDNTADNSSQSSVQVIPAQSCNIGVTATASPILCNGGTTSITATATGANGAVEYNLNGGSFQTSNIFPIVNASGSPYTVIAREVTNISCTATSAPVIITNPPIVPLPTVSVTQPTCTVATGIVTITSSTNGLTFSLDGDPNYNPYTIPLILATGPHTLIAKNANGCISAITNFTVNAQPPTPTAPTVTIVQPTCTVATGTITITSSTTNLEFSLDGGAYAAYPVGGYTLITIGAHTLFAKNLDGCISLVTNITLNAQPPTPAAPSVTVIQPTCTVATGTITITSSTTNLEFSLDGGAYAAYPVGGYTLVTTGAHTLFAKNLDGCISLVTNITVNAQPPTPAAPSVTVIQPTCTVATGTITITSSTINLEFSLDGSAYVAYPVGGYTLVTTGAHTLFARNLDGCISPVTNITLNAQPPTPAAPIIGTITQPTCAISTGTVVLNNLPAGDWIINPGAIAGNTSSTTLTSLAAGTYNYTVTNSFGCISGLSANVVIDPVPGAPDAPTVSVSQPTCTVATATISITSAIAGLTFSYNGGPYLPYTGPYTNILPGTYTITLQNAASCISPVTTVIVNPQPPTPAAPTVSIVQPTCSVATGIVTITSSTGGLTFSVDGGNYNIYTSPLLLISGSHTITAQNANGCISAITNIIINAQPPTPVSPTVGTIVHPTCILSGSVVLSDLPSGNWEINPGGIIGSGASTTVTGLAPGTYNFTVTNTFGCTSTQTSTVVINPITGIPTAPTVNIIQPSCTVATGSIEVTSSTIGLEFSLNGGTYVTYTTPFSVVAGTYTLTSRNPTTGCISPITNIIINAQPPTPSTPTISVIQPTCTVATATVIITSSTTNLTFSFNGATYGGYPAGGYQNLTPGTYTLTAQNTNGCISPVSNITINTQPPTPAAPTITIAQPSCTVATGTIIVTSTTTGLTFSLNGAAYGVYPIGGYQNLTPGTYTLTAQNTSGCISTLTTLTINTQPPTPAAPTAIITQPTCTVATGTIIVTSTTTGLTFSLNGAAYGVYPVGGYQNLTPNNYTLTAQNTSGCISVVTNVTLNPQPSTPTATITSGTIACFNGSTTLTVNATGGIAPYQYSLNSGTFQSANTFTVPAGTHTIVVRGANLCATSAVSITVVQPTNLTASASANVIACNGGTTTLTVISSGGTTPYQYSLNGGTFQLSNTFTVGIGNQTVTVRDANGCTRVTNSVLVTQPSVLSVTATAPRITTCGGTTLITVSATGGRLPFTGVGTFVKGPGIWSYTITDASGCTATTQIEIEAPGCMNLRVFPNPAKNTITINHSVAEGGSSILIYSINGALVLTKTIAQNSFITTLNVSNLAAGAYSIVYLNGNDKKAVLFEKIN